MTSHQLVTKMEALGAEFVVQNGSFSILPPLELTPATQKKFQRLLERARKNSYLLGYWLREREASRAWEASGKNPHWWRE